MTVNRGIQQIFQVVIFFVIFYLKENTPFGRPWPST